MKQLYALSKAKRKVWKEIPNGSHNNTVAEPYFFNYVFDFIAEELGRRGWQLSTKYERMFTTELWCIIKSVFWK